MYRWDYIYDLFKERSVLINEGNKKERKEVKIKMQ